MRYVKGLAKDTIKLLKRQNLVAYVEKILKNFGTKYTINFA